MNVELDKEDLKKSERVAMRLTPLVKKQLERAAAIEGRSLTDFVVAAALDAARSTIERTHVIRLTLRDSERFMEALRNPPEPSEAWAEAAALHAEAVKKKQRG
jgi:uncharacterized protein (DUF1778 family)